ncbi:conserved membrane hypothetical protein [Sphingomonas sp. EC-HK361]|uniref:hypothetical protein n=1 Tax=Sphingomonas sp. EC-HK361 TaxID=2038397 RepID=UPI001252BE64|nr:hypothetical protein [Sphingomonas sp. EC-HK361]VVS96954.1 conserved membrane hypothetical protein [Sphingomonas sp. EC-HK361]
MSRSKARQRYNMAILGCSAGYACALFGGEAYFQNHPGANGVTAYAAAIIPALMIVGMFFAIGRYLVEEQDEYQRMLMVRQSLVASGFALSIATVWGFLESFGLAPHVDAYYVAVMWFGGLGLGACVNRLIERRS